MAACDFDNPSNANSRFCSGACNSALTSAAAECTSTEFVTVKSVADEALAMCFGCMSHAVHYSSDCAGIQDLLGEEDGMSDISAMHAVVCGGACYDRLTQASNDSTPAIRMRPQ